MVEMRLRRAVIGVVAAVFLCGQAAALTVYDVIQLSSKNYADDDILALIQATGSAFELKAGDITQLMEVGVSEKVIQAMLRASPGEATTGPTETSAGSPPDTGSHTESHIAADIAGGRFAYEPFSESGVGRHHHSVVTLAGVKLLVLRDEGAFSSVAARADAVVSRLARVALEGQGTFRPDHSPGGNSVVFYGKSNQRPVVVLSVTSEDATAYQRRSGRAVKPALLAAYWSDLLSDYWSVVVDKTAPVRLAGLHEGEALDALLVQWGKTSETEEARLLDAALLLPRQTQQHLLQLATTVPHDFSVSHTRPQGHP